MSPATALAVPKTRRKLRLLALAMVLLMVGGLTTPSVATVTGPPAFALEWGSLGSGDGQFDRPYGVAADGFGNVYVVDQFNHRIQKFDSDGNFLTKWGSFGSGDGQFNEPLGAAADALGNIYVADSRNRRVQKFDSDGNFLTKWGSSGSGDGQFGYPHFVAVSASGDVYVTAGADSRVQKFDSDGNFLTKWGSSGSGDGQFNAPHGVAVDASGNVYVVDFLNYRVQKFDSAGNFLTKWGSFGSGDGEFGVGPTGIAIDASGNVYVTDGGNQRVQVFDAVGDFLAKWGSPGTGDGQFNAPTTIAVGPGGDVYVADYFNHRIQKFAFDGEGPVVTGVTAAPNPAAVGEEVVLTATVDDSGTGDSVVAAAEYAIDGGLYAAMNASDGTFDGTTEAVEATLGSFDASDVHTICVRGSDAAGNTGGVACTFLAVYDPTAGFATGGGWIIPGGNSSDPGDLLPGLDGASKANFGFVVKYQDGASTVPGGNLAFHYNVGQFHLHSAGMEWLVVTNSNWAKFQGSAAIDGLEGLYPFRVDARDGGSQADRFIIKIYPAGGDPSVDEPIYKASGDLGGGQIKIHN